MGKERFLKELGALTEVTKMNSGKSDPVRDISVDKSMNPSAEKNYNVGVMQIPSNQIESQIRAGNIRVLVIGLGQAGLPLALHFAKEGISVTGADIDKQKVNNIKQGICPLNGNDLTNTFNQVSSNGNFLATYEVIEAVKTCDVHIICVPTPLSNDKLPDISALHKASEAVGKGLKKGDLVIIESTVYPGVTSNIVKPILEKYSGLKAGDDFGLAYCFERIDPGNIEHRIDNTPKVVGAINRESTDATATIYSMIVKAPIIKTRNCETAELVKLVENIYRDINIAFANEVALLCEKLDIDVLEVLNAALTKWNFVPHVPGAGVGGMCIPVNPYYLLKCARELGLNLELVQKAREINESMPNHMVQLVKDAFNKIQKPIDKSKICILGLAYKADVNDCRGAPAEKIAAELKQLGAQVICYDPVVTPEPQDIDFSSSFEEAVRGSDCVVITSDHTAFRSLNLQNIIQLARTPFAIVDGRHVLVPREVEALGITYVGLGRNQNSNLNIWNYSLISKWQEDKV